MRTVAVGNLIFETTFKHNAFAALNIWDVTGSVVPTSLNRTAQVAMTEAQYGTFTAYYTLSDQHQYLIQAVEYTDGTYTTPSPGQSPGSETYFASAGGNFTSLITQLQQLILIVAGLGGPLLIAQPKSNVELLTPALANDILLTNKVPNVILLGTC